MEKFKIAKNYTQGCGIQRIEVNKKKIGTTVF